MVPPASTRTGAVSGTGPVLVFQREFRSQQSYYSGNPEKLGVPDPGCDRVWLIEHECTLMAAYPEDTQSPPQAADASTAAVADVSMADFVAPTQGAFSIVPVLHRSEIAPASPQLGLRVAAAPG